MINIFYQIIYILTITCTTYGLFIPDCDKTTTSIGIKNSTISHTEPTSVGIITLTIPDPEPTSIGIKNSTIPDPEPTSVGMVTLTIPDPEPTSVGMVTLTIPDPEPTSVGMVNNSLENDCLFMHNQARSLYNPLAKKLSWDSQLVFRCAAVAQYCATVSQTHFDLGDNSTTPGLFVNAQNLFITQTSCSSAYNGWITNEINDNGGHYLNIINGDYSRVGCSVSYEGLQCICCDFSI